MTVRIAMVGAGPRALWALEELAVVSRERNLPMDIDVFDLHDPGTGSAWDPHQPSCWLVNVRTAAIATGAGSFDEWRGHDDTTEFPPRAQVGEFLAYSWEVMLGRLPRQMRVNYCRRYVSDLAELAGYDEILLVTGHARPDTPAGMIDPYRDGLDAIAPGEDVLVRGGALTFIDVAVALTYGRGGRRVDDTYVASGREPARIRAYTRSESMIQVKPSLLTDAEARVLEAYRRPMLAAQGVGDIVAVLEAAASDIAARPVTLDDAQPSTDPVGSWRASLDDDRRAPQVLGLVWRELYPQLIEHVSWTELAVSDDFFALTRLMEPLAFGPPPEQIRRLLALVDAGILETGASAGDPADHVVDAVLAPAGRVPGTLEYSLGRGRCLRTDRAGMVEGHEHVASIGRTSEPWILGHDSLNRALHSVAPAWARRIGAVYGPQGVHGIPPLTARLEDWSSELVGEPDTARELVECYSSPVNVLDVSPMGRNVRELTSSGQRASVDVRIFFARKANKALAFVDEARRLGQGVDVASLRELQQVLASGMPGELVIVSAAIKTDELLETAIAGGVTVSVDNVAELHRLSALAGERTVAIAPRLAPDPATMPPTRFGERIETWREALSSPVPGIDVRGVHVHLHGYAAADRIAAIREAMALIDDLSRHGHHLEFIDVGGGVPMSYLDDADQWANYLAARDAMNAGEMPPFTWKSDPLKNTYPFHQKPVRGPWLDEVLAAVGPGLKARGLRLHLEPGRSLLDGCGMTLARVAFVKRRSDGLPLVGLEMNRTQLRTTSDDCLMDPLLIRQSEAPGEELEAFLVGAYCIEDEIILRRRIRFAEGVSVGDIVAFPNTAGYFMHILESASHQIPLALNVVHEDTEFRLDEIDARKQ